MQIDNYIPLYVSIHSPMTGPDQVLKFIHFGNSLYRAWSSPHALLLLLECLYHTKERPALTCMRQRAPISIYICIKCSQWKLNEGLKDMLGCSMFSNFMMGKLKLLPLIFMKEILPGKSVPKI